MIARLKRGLAAIQDGGFTLTVTLLSLLPRLYVAIAWTREPVWDGHYYHFGAQRIAEGLGYSEDVVINGVSVWKPWCHYPVGYSAFLGGLYKLLGSELWVAPVANALVGALTVLVAHRIAVLWLSKRRARIAALLVALHPGLILYTALVMTEALSAFTLLLVGFFALAFSHKARGAVLSGLTLGLGALVRPTALLAGPLLLCVFGRKPTGESSFAGFSLSRTLRLTAIAVAASLLIILPWTVRNCMVMDGCALISTNGGWNLAIGALTDTGRFRTLTADDGCPIVTGQVQQDRCWANVGLETIKRDPVAWLELVPKKLAHTYNHESFATGYLAEANPALWTPERKESVRASVTVFHHLLMAGAALAAIALPWPRSGRLRAASPERLRNWLKRLQPASLVQPALLAAALAWTVYCIETPEHPFFWLIVVAPLLFWMPLPRAPKRGPVAYYLSGLVIATTLTHALFFGDDRYHMTVSPVLCILAAAALRRPAATGPV